MTRADELPMPVAMPMARTADPGSERMESSVATAPKRAITAAGVGDDQARQQRFARQMERGLSSAHFDSARWIAQFTGVSPSERARGAQRLLLAVEPQQAADLTADSLALVHGLVLDAAYQLK